MLNRARFIAGAVDAFREELLAEMPKALLAKASRLGLECTDPWGELRDEDERASVLSWLSTLRSNAVGLILHIEKLGVPPNLKLSKTRS
jgi:hypothetical protein